MKMKEKKKANKRRVLLCLIVACLVTGPAYAEGGKALPDKEAFHPECADRFDRGPGFHHRHDRRFGFDQLIPGLTQDQQSKIKQIRIHYEKEIQPLRNEAGELFAKLRTASTKDGVDLKEVDSVIDNISDVQAKIMKLHAAERVEIRKLLTDEQKLYLDDMGRPGMFRPMRPFREPGV